MSRVLSQEEISIGIKLIDTIVTKLDEKITELTREEERIKDYSQFSCVLKKYQQNTDTALMNRIKNLLHFIDGVIGIELRPGIFPVSHYTTSEHRMLAHEKSPEYFKMLIYDLAQLLAANEFNRLVKMVYTTKGGWEYKKGNELDRYYNITSHLMELLLDENPETFEDID